MFRKQFKQRSRVKETFIISNAKINNKETKNVLSMSLKQQDSIIISNNSSHLNTYNNLWNNYQDQNINESNISITNFLKQNQKQNSFCFQNSNDKKLQNQNDKKLQNQNDKKLQKLQQLTQYLIEYICSKNKYQANMQQMSILNLTNQDNTYHNYSWSQVLQKVLNFYKIIEELVNVFQQPQPKFQQEPTSKFSQDNKQKRSYFNKKLKNNKFLKQLLQITIFFIKEQKSQLNQISSHVLIKMIKLKTNLFSKFFLIVNQKRKNYSSTYKIVKNNDMFLQFQAVIFLKNLLKNIFLCNIHYSLYEELLNHLFENIQSKTIAIVLAELSIEIKSINKKTTILEIILQRLSASQSQFQQQATVQLSQNTREYLSKIMRIMCQHILQNNLSNQFQKEVCMASFAIISHLKSLFPRQVLVCFHSQNYSIINKIMKMSEEIDQNLYKTMKKYFSQIPFNQYEIKEFTQVKNQKIKELFFQVKKKQIQLEILAKYIFQNQLKLETIDYKLVLLLIIQFQSKDQLVQLRMLLDEIAKINDVKFSKAILELLSYQKLYFNGNHQKSSQRNEDSVQDDEFFEMSKKMEDCHKLVLLSLLYQSMVNLYQNCRSQLNSTCQIEKLSYFKAVEYFSMFFKKQYTKQKRPLRYKLMKILSKLDDRLIKKMNIIQEKYIKVSLQLKQKTRQKNSQQIKFY